MKSSIIFVGISLLWIPFVLGEYRIFTSTDGRKLEAQPLQIMESKVEVMRKIDGEKVWIPLGSLVESDRKFLSEWEASEDHATTGVRLRPKKRLLQSRSRIMQP